MLSPRNRVWEMMSSLPSLLDYTLKDLLGFSFHSWKNIFALILLQDGRFLSELRSRILSNAWK